MLRCVSTLLVLVLAALPVGSQVFGRDTLRPADQALLEAQVGPASATWTLRARAPSGAVTALNGLVPLRGGDTEERLADLLERFGPLFDLDDAIELGAPEIVRRHPDGRARHVRLPQLVHGLEVVGHGLRLELTPEGDARVVRGVVSHEAAALEPPRISEARALDLARQHLEDQGHDPGAARKAPHVSARLVDPQLRGMVPVIRVGVVLADHTPLAIDVDAHDGVVLGSRLNATHLGQGTYIDNGVALPFETGKGKGVAYRSFQHALADKAKKRPLRELGMEDVGQALDNSLFGRFAFVLDHTPSDQFFLVAGVDHQFLGFPDPLDISAANLFDATNCYLHLTGFALFMTQLAGGSLPTDFAMPTLVNSPYAPFNAFYSPEDLGLGTGPGFLVFGDSFYETGFLSDDLARDPTVVAHEYLHAITDFYGLGFGAPPLHSPPRAVNEAIADYFAASYHDDPRIGLPAAQLGSPPFVQGMGLSDSDGLRNLANPLTVLDNLFDVTVDGLPEEHVAGHIFGASLWAVREAIKGKKADGLILDSLFNWPQSLAELGYLDYGPDNAEAAYRDYYAECLTQLVFDAIHVLGATKGQRVLGAVMRHGGLGLAEAGSGLIVDLGDQGGSLRIDSAFLGSSAGHLVGVVLQAGQSAKLILKGNKQAGTAVDLSIDGPEGGLTLVKPPIDKGHQIKLPRIEVNQSGLYLLSLLNDGETGDTPRPYRLRLKVQ